MFATWTRSRPSFKVLCGKVTPSHAHGHPVGFGGEVDIFGMIILSGDLIHADRHGAVIVPHDVAKSVPDAARLCMRREAPVLEVARGAGRASAPCRRVRHAHLLVLLH